MRAYSHELTPPDATPMQPLRLADQVRRMLPDDSIISVDTGNHAHYFAAFYPVRSGGSLPQSRRLDPHGLGTDRDHRAPSWPSPTRPASRSPATAAF